MGPSQGRLPPPPPPSLTTAWTSHILGRKEAARQCWAPQGRTHVCTGSGLRAYTGHVWGHGWGGASLQVASEARWVDCRLRYLFPPPTSSVIEAKGLGSSVL